MKIVILSKGKNLYSTRRLYEASEAAGCDVSIADYTRCYCVVEQGASEVYLEDKPLEADIIIPRIGASYTEYGAAIIRQYEMLGVFTTTSSISLVRARDKLRSLQILGKSANGIQIPKTAFASHPDNIDNLIKVVGGAPLVVKIVEGTQGLGVVLAETRSAARSVVQAFYGLQVNILLQEFIKESAGTDLRVFVVNGKVIASMMRKNDGGDFRANLHQGGSAVKVKLSKEERTVAVRAAKELGLSIAGVDILRSNRGPLVLEVNASPGLEGVEEATGVDVAGAIVNYAITKIDKNLKDRVGI